MFKFINYECPIDPDKIYQLVTFSVHILNFRNLTHLTLSDCFNQPIDHLPKTLTHLILGEKFSS